MTAYRQGKIETWDRARLGLDAAAESLTPGVTIRRNALADATPGERLAAAADQADAEDFAFEATVAMDGLGLPQDGIKLTGTVDIQSARLAGTMRVGPTTVELLQDGTAQYYRIPGAEAAGHKPWQRLDLSGLGVTSNTSTGASNPLDSFRQLGAIVGEVEEVGHEDVRGVDTTHFHATIDATKVRAPRSSVPTATIDAMRRIPVDVWLDGKDRVRRYRQAIDLRAAGAPGIITTTTEAFDFGKDVTIELPADADVEDIDVAGLGSLLGGAAGQD
jgi:hypothetical protein